MGTSIPITNPLTIMASTGNYWWMTPIQAVATLGAAVNFGGSALQSPLIMPMLQMPEGPAVHADKLPFVGSAFGLSVATTAYALGIMVPMNRRMAALSDNLNVNSADDKSEKELRQLQKRWQKLNYGRAPIMIASAIAGVFGLLQDGSTLRL